MKWINGLTGYIWSNRSNGRHRTTNILRAFILFCLAVLCFVPALRLHPGPSRWMKRIGRSSWRQWPYPADRLDRFVQSNRSSEWSRTIHAAFWLLCPGCPPLSASLSNQVKPTPGTSTVNTSGTTSSLMWFFSTDSTIKIIKCNKWPMFSSFDEGDVSLRHCREGAIDPPFAS